MHRRRVQAVRQPAEGAAGQGGQTLALGTRGAMVAAGSGMGGAIRTARVCSWQRPPLVQTSSEMSLTP